MRALIQNACSISSCCPSMSYGNEPAPISANGLYFYSHSLLTSAYDANPSNAQITSYMSSKSHRQCPCRFHKNFTGFLLLGKDLVLFLLWLTISFNIFFFFLSSARHLLRLDLNRLRYMCT